MYIPKHWHWFGPMTLILLGFYIRQNYGAYWDVFILVQLPLATLAIEWGTYIWQAGVLYQRYITGAPVSNAKPVGEILDWNTGKPIDDSPRLVPVNSDGSLKTTVTINQAVEMPRFDIERRFAVDVLRMYDFDPVAQKHVDMTEEKWVIQKKMFSQKPFANMKRKWEHFGVIRRKTDKKNSPFVVNKREAVALIASGNSLPEWSPTPQD